MIKELFLAKNRRPPEVYLDELLAKKGKDHFFRLLNWELPREKYAGGMTFLVFDAVAIEEYLHLRLRKNQSCRLNVGKASFLNAIQRLLEHHAVDLTHVTETNMKTNMEVSIKRINHKTIMIDHLKLYEVNPDTEKTIIQLDTKDI